MFFSFHHSHAPCLNALIPDSGISVPKRKSYFFLPPSKIKTVSNPHREIPKINIGIFNSILTPFPCKKTYLPS